MNSEVKIKSPNIKLTFTIGFFITVLVIVLALVFRFEFSLILLSIAGSIGLIGIVSVIGLGGKILYRFKIWQLDIAERQENLRLTTAKANKAELEALVISFPSSHRLASLPNSGIEVIEGIARPIKELPASTQEPLDLLTVFTQLTQSYACIGGQQTGKTYQMRHIAQYWLDKGIKPVIVGPKWDRGEWLGCILFGGSGDFSEVSKGITIVRQEAQKRHADSDKSHKEHAILPVFFDDWTPIVDAVDNARELVLQATTLYASVNIILYFILHSDTSNAWGVDKKGAALKDNFIKLFIVPHYDSSGLIIREKTRGYIKFAGDGMEHPVKLFNAPIVPSGQILDYPSELDLEVQPTPDEAFVLKLYGEGESYRSISQAVYGNHGQFYNEKIEQILQKFGEK